MCVHDGILLSHKQENQAEIEAAREGSALLRVTASVAASGHRDLSQLAFHLLASPKPAFHLPSWTHAAAGPSPSPTLHRNTGSQMRKLA